MPLIPALKRQNQVRQICELEASLVSIWILGQPGLPRETLSQKAKKNKQKQKQQLHQISNFKVLGLLSWYNLDLLNEGYNVSMNISLVQNGFVSHLKDLLECSGSRLIQNCFYVEMFFISSSTGWIHMKRSCFFLETENQVGFTNYFAHRHVFSCV